MKTAGLIVLLSFVAAGAELQPMVDQQLPSLLAIYRDLHAHPELSHHEEHTAAFVADELRKAGFTVTEHVGRYADGTAAFGVVALMKNGPGPVVLVRTELDALPVEERTGLPYASQIRTRNAAGQDVGVMHACGHDLHMTSFLGTARMLASLKDRWSGTLMLIGQPSEETIDGSRAMLADGLYSRFPKPDYAIALHDTPGIEVGKVGVVAGALLASSTSVDVIIRGMGGHGAHPEATKDPIVMAAEFVMALQTIVSRQISPQDPAVVTVGSIHGGSKHNIIPDEVTLQISTRAFNEDVRKNILADIERTARGIALAAGVPADRAPIVKVSETEAVPVTWNDPQLAVRMNGVFVAALGERNVVDPGPEMGSEDFGLFGLAGRQIPIFMFKLGATAPARLEESKRTGTPLPSLHSSLFYPEAEPAIRTGVMAMTAAVLDLLRK
ncbi:MAG: amidohydrolase [Bryobacteraceae bacterium]|jgi:hippurate hydrolase